MCKLQDPEQRDCSKYIRFPTRTATVLLRNSQFLYYFLLDGNAFCKIPGLVNITFPQNCNVIRQ